MGSSPSKNLSPVDIDLYFWYGRSGAVGHVSLFLKSNYLYLSFWPAEHVKFKNSAKNVPSTTNSFQEDKAIEGRNPDRTISTTLQLDVSAMESWWSSEKRKDYNFLTNNCSDAVHRALEAGNDDFVMSSDFMPPTTTPQNIQPMPSWTSKDFCTWIRYELANFRLKGLHGLTN